jgi:hypothetical protein
MAVLSKRVPVRVASNIDEISSYNIEIKKTVQVFAEWDHDEMDTSPGPSVGVGMQPFAGLPMTFPVMSAAAATSFDLLAPAATSALHVALTGQAGSAPIA